MVIQFEEESVQRSAELGTDGNTPETPCEGFISDASGGHELSAVDMVLGLVPQSLGRFRFFIADQRWEWSDAVARMHGYEPGTVEPTTELLLRHKHPDDRECAAAVLDRVLSGTPFSSRHRIIDAAGRTRCVVVVGDQMFDDTGAVIGTSGFYVDVTESLSSDISTVLSQVAASRARIEQAKGVLMAAYDISEDRAFNILVWRSQESNLKLRDVAARFMAAVAGRASADTLAHVDHALLTLQ